MIRLNIPLDSTKSGGRFLHDGHTCANLNVGHGGTFMDPNGGREASVAVSWLDWQPKGDAHAARRFVGADCGLCNDPDWNVDSKNLTAVNH